MSKSTSDTTPPAPPLSFIGLGAMGHAMSITLLRSGFPLTAFDISSQAISRFQSSVTSDLPSTSHALASVAPSPAAASKSVNICLFMVANQAHVESALTTPETGAIHTLPRGAVLLICSTVSPSYITSLRTRLDDPKDLNRADLLLIDAPVSGGVARSATGTLTIMASSHTPSDLERTDVLAVLNALSDGGANTFIVPGGLGSGTKLKALNQVNCGVNITFASELMACASSAGLDLNTRTFSEYISRATLPSSPDNRKYRAGWTWMLANRAPRMLDPSLPMASAMHIIVKDVGIILDEASRLTPRCELPLLRRARGVLDTAMDRGWAGEDDSRVVWCYLPTDTPNLVVSSGAEQPDPKPSAKGTQHAGIDAVSGADQHNSESAMSDLATAGSLVQLQGAYETCKFAAGLGLTSSAEQVRQWVKVLRGAAGGSPVFDGVVEAVYGDVLHGGDGGEKEKKGSWEERFKSFARDEFEVQGKLGTLEKVLEESGKKGFDAVLMKESARWLREYIL